MSKSMYKIKQIEDNALFSETTINDHILPALFISKANQAVAVMLLQKIGKMENPEGNVINKETFIINVVNDLYKTSETAIKKEDSLGITIANLAKKVIEDKIMPTLTKQDENLGLMSVEDLMSKLYENNESRGKTK